MLKGFCVNYFKQFRQTYMVNFWRPTPAVIALGVLAAYYFGITGTYWAVTGEFTRWRSHLAIFWCRYQQLGILQNYENGRNFPNSY